MQKDVEAWCQRCAVCGKCKAIVRGHGQLQQPTYGTFNERVSVDLMGPFKRNQDGNEYIVVMQDHFTKWVEGRAICGKEALTNAIVQVWVLKHGAPISLHSDRGKEFTAVLHQEVCDMPNVCDMNLPRHTLQLPGHKPTAWWNVVIEHSWQCYGQ